MPRSSKASQQSKSSNQASYPKSCTPGRNAVFFLLEEDSFRPGVFFGGHYLSQSAVVPRFILQMQAKEPATSRFERRTRGVQRQRQAQQLWGRASLKRRQVFTPSRRKQCTSRSLRSWGTLSLRALLPHLHALPPKIAHRRLARVLYSSFEVDVHSKSFSVRFQQN